MLYVQHEASEHPTAKLVVISLTNGFHEVQGTAATCYVQCTYYRSIEKEPK